MTGRNGSQEAGPDYDVVVVGAGFAGLYLLRRLREQGFSTRVLESADDVGGTWYWNRYPGARCDIPTTDYTYSFDPELERDWTWSEKYATQPEILRYLQFVADRYDLRRDIDFSTRVAAAAWDDAASLWRVRTDAGDELSCRFYVMATGCLSMPKEVDIEGADRFGGDVYFTSRWPHEGVDFTGKRVAVIGTGSSAVAVHPAHRRAGCGADRVPAHPGVLGPRAQRSPSAGSSRGNRGRPRGVPRCGEAFARGHPCGAARAHRGDVFRGGAPRSFRGRIRGRRALRHPRHLRRPGGQPRVQRDRRRDDPGEGSVDRDRRRDRRVAVPRRTTTSAPSGRVSTRATSRPTTSRTSVWSTCARTRSRPSPRPASTRSATHSSSMRSSTRPDSTR